jgi:hypothetical protein
MLVTEAVVLKKKTFNVHLMCAKDKEHKDLIYKGDEIFIAAIFFCW